MRKKYLENWKNSFNIENKISRRDFWIFLVVNYLILILLLTSINGLAELSDSNNKNFDFINVIISTLFIVPIITAAIRRLNDINKPKFYVLIPFYNIFLLAQKGMSQSDSIDNDVFPVKFLVRIVVGCLLIGIANAVISVLLLTVLDDNAGLSAGFGVLLFSLWSVPIALFILFMYLLLMKESVSQLKINSALRYLFIFILPILLVLIYFANQ